MSGVPQGSVLGPLFFLILVADINRELQHSQVALFTDDMKVKSNVQTEGDVALQQDLNHLNWADVTSMKVNVKKSELMKYDPLQDINQDTK